MTFNWSTVTLENYIAIDKTRQSEGSDPIIAGVSILSLLTGKPESHFEDMHLPELQGYLIEMHKFLNVPIEPKLVKEFKIDGRKFYVGTNFNEFTESQRRKLSCFCGSHLEDYTMIGSPNHNMTEKYPELVAILVGEKTRFKKHLDFEQRVKLFHQLPAMIAVGIALFFWNVSPKILEELALLLQSKTEKIAKS